MTSRPIRRRISVEEIEKLEDVSAYALFLWLFVAIGPFTDVIRWRMPHPVWGAAGFAAFVACYCFAIVLAFGEDKGPGRPAAAAPTLLAGATAVLASVLAGSYHSWGSLFALSGVACGAVLTGRLSRCAIVLLPVLAFVVCAVSHKDEGWSTAFNAFLSILVTNAFLELMSTVLQLKETREELARSAVATERLRFSRDLHDLLGHSMSVIAVKAEATRRLAPLDLKLALEQAADIEAVSRQALTEIREAVTGYRRVSLAEELDQARAALRSAGIKAVVRESGPPLSAQTEALLGWVVREGVTNVIRHSGGRECVIELLREQDPVRLRIRDDGAGAGAGSDSASGSGSDADAGPVQAEPCPGNGLKGLAERLATAGGTLTRVPSAKGFVLLATLPGEPGEPGGADRAESDDGGDSEAEESGRDPSPSPAWRLRLRRSRSAAAGQYSPLGTAEGRADPTASEGARR